MLLAEQQIGTERLARPRGTDRERGDEVVGSDEAGTDAGGEAQRDRGDVAAGHGDATGVLERSALRRTVAQQQLGEAVGPRAGIVAPVELGPVRFIRETVIGAAVDHESVGGEV